MKRMDFTKYRRRQVALIFLLLVLNMAGNSTFAQRIPLVTLDLKNEVLSSALKRIERQGGKSILFTYKETNRYRVSASLRRKTQQEAIDIVLSGKPFESLERKDYFVIRFKERGCQTSLVHGTVTDEKGHPLAYANVLLLDASNRTYISGCITDEDGGFMLPAVGETKAVLKVSYIGYEPATVTCRENNTIRLQPDSKLLKEVKVTSSRPLVEWKSGALVANVQGTALSLLGSAADMIGHLPMVVGTEGDYKVIGRGTPEIYINGRKVRDTGELNRLQANEVLSAEIITSPGVRYAADVPAVIRLKTVKKRGQGLSGSVYAQYRQGQRPLSNGGIKLNYRVGGLDIFVSGLFDQTHTYQTEHSTMKLWGNKTVWRSETDDILDGKSVNFSGELGFDYEVNDHQSFGVRYVPGKNLRDDLSHTYGNTVLYQDGSVADRLDFDTRTSTSGKWSHSLNAYYTGTFGRWNIDFNADYYTSDNFSDQLAHNNGETAAVSSDKVNNDLYATKLVASVALGRSSFSFGTEEIYTDRHDLFRQDGFSADADDHIRQMIFAGFADYSLNLDKWSFTTGMRYEHQRVRYYNAGSLKEGQSPTYNHFIPMTSVSWQSGDWNTVLGYKMLKMSPEYSMLSSAVNYVSKYQYQNGNPLLVPQKHNMFTLDAGWKWVNFSAYFDYVRNMYTSYFKSYDAQTHPAVVQETMAGIPKSYSYGTTLVLTPKIGCWQINFTTDMSFFDSDGRSIGIPHNWKEPQFTFSWNNSLILPKGWFIDVISRISTRAKQSYGINKRTGSMSARVSKQFFKDKSLQVSLIAYDLFHTGYYYYTSYGDRTFYDHRRYMDSQRIGIRVNYKFNATKSKYKGTGAGQDERDRL